MHSRDRRYLAASFSSHWPSLFISKVLPVLVASACSFRPVIRSWYRPAGIPGDGYGSPRRKSGNCEKVMTKGDIFHNFFINW